MNLIRIGLAQLNPIVGDLEGNCRKVLEAMERSVADKIDLLVFPELFLTGYPPEDLLLRQDFIECVEIQIQSIIKATGQMAILIGAPIREGHLLYNSALMIGEGRIMGRYHKQVLPNHGVFDEKRYFSEGRDPGVFDFNGIRLGVTICEDIWHEAPFHSCVKESPDLVLSLNASPFHREKLKERHRLIQERTRASGVPVAYVNLVGGQDELVFDGGSFAMNEKGDLCLQAPEFQEGVFHLELTPGGNPHLESTTRFPPLEQAARIYQALVTGISDYARKNGFQGAVLGLSGGIDSALTLALAVDALGPEHVEAALMPSRFTSEISNTDAIQEAQWLGCKSHIIPIEPLFRETLDLLAPAFEGYKADLTEENIQARCRGILLMALSNKKGKILLTTGNKSEMSVGYATLYGDMAGGFAPLKDIPKMMVYELARYRNQRGPAIPERVLLRPPSAELREDQRDEDSLPPYPILDAILEGYIEQDLSVETLIDSGFDAMIVNRVVHMVDRNEYKRRQAPPGVKVTQRAFGRDRRYPMTNGFIHRET